MNSLLKCYHNKYYCLYVELTRMQGWFFKIPAIFPKVDE